MSQGRVRVFLLWLADLACVYSCWALAVWGYWVVGIGHYEYGFDFYLRLWPVGIAFTALNLVFKLYHGSILYPAAPVSPVEELRRLMASAAFTHLGVIAVLALSRQTTKDYSRVVIVLSGIFTAFFAQPARNLIRSVMLRVGWGQIPVILTGAGAVAEHVASALAADAYTGFRVVRTFGNDFREIVPQARRLGVKILVACQDMRMLRAQIEAFTSWFTFIEYMPSAEAFPVLGAQPVAFDGLGGLEMVNQRRMKAMRLGKSALDLLLSLLAFFCLLPFFVIIPVLVKLTSRGPVFYRANRLGKCGRPIRVWKFRSMYADADERLAGMLAANPALKAEFEANFKLVDDPRVTPLGRFLRKTSLDELPQLFNVFSGEMALIGPRPIVEREVGYYGKAYSIFSSVKPGITGLWQTSGRSDTDYARRIALDSYYVLNWSPWLDIWILFRTVGAVLFMRGAC